jgi:enoyl-CoA hydratase/carnithine racemase
MEKKMVDVVVEFNNEECVITLNRANKKNALIPSMYEDLAVAIERASEDTSCRVVVLRADGADFTAGNDISEFADGSKSGLDCTIRFMRALMRCPLPVVAQVKGNAIGIGTTMLLHCDFVVAATKTNFMMPFINLGLVPEYASSFLLPKVSGHINAAKWLMLGSPFGAQEALQNNLVTSVHDLEELDNAVAAICDQLKSKPRTAMIQTKALIKHDLSAINDHIDIELKYFAEALESPAAKEAFDAFLNKRPVDKTRFLA